MQKVASDVGSKDPHEILGIPRGANVEDAKKAYRKLAAKFHPDVASGDVSKFREITEAFNSIRQISDFEHPGADPIFCEDVSTTVELTLEEMVFGCNKAVRVRVGAKCKLCSGTGSAPGSPMMPCLACLGTGKSPSAWGFNNSARTCSTCKGLGTTPAQRCKQCAGKGRADENVEVRVRVPAGIDDGQDLGFFGNIS